MKTQYLVFSSEDCQPCKNLKKWLKANDVEYTLHDATSPKAVALRVRSVPTSIRLVGGAVDSTIVGFQPKEAKRFFNV